MPVPKPKKKRTSTAKSTQRKKPERQDSFDVDDYLKKYDFPTEDDEVKHGSS